MHEASIRIPLVVRYPGLTPANRPRIIDGQVLTIDFAPSILDICNVKPLEKVHGRSWKNLVKDDSKDWRKAWYYEYNYEKQFPYTPNVRGIRTDQWKYMHYPHGDGSPDRHMAELYNIQEDPNETRNLIDRPEYASLVESLKKDLRDLIRKADGIPDKMPLDEGIKSELPDKDIR
jgi:N-acetylglucosamine-6-sulfatase